MLECAAPKVIFDGPYRVRGIHDGQGLRINIMGMGSTERPPELTSGSTCRVNFS